MSLVNCPTPRHPIECNIFVQQPHYDVLDASAVGTGAVWTRCGGASPCGLPDCIAVDAPASLARRVGASAVLCSPLSRSPSSVTPTRTLALSWPISLEKFFVSLKNGCYNLSDDCYKRICPIRSKRTKMLLQPE